MIIDMLPELGVTEKKTHSSSIDEPVAEILRQASAWSRSGGAQRRRRRKAAAPLAERIAEPEQPKSRAHAERRSAEPPVVSREAPRPAHAP